MAIISYFYPKFPLFTRHRNGHANILQLLVPSPAEDAHSVLKFPDNYHKAQKAQNPVLTAALCREKCHRDKSCKICQQISLSENISPSEITFAMKTTRKLRS